MREQVEAELSALPDLRAPLPMAYSDPAFMACLHEAIGTTELVAGFDRLYGATIGARRAPIDAMVDHVSGKQESDIRAFVNFVHDAIYLRLPSKAIHALRLANMKAKP